MACQKISGLSSYQIKIINMMVNSIPEHEAPKEDYLIQITEKIELLRQNSLWHGGQIACIRYKGFTFSIEAAGDVRAYIYDTAQEDHLVIYVKDKNNSGNLYGEMRPYIKSDKGLERAMSDSPGKYRLQLEEGNWFEVFVSDKDGEWFPDSWIADSDGILSAVVEVLTLMDDFIDGHEESKVESK